MGAFIARQPNGLLCRFSSVVDAITHYNMTEDDYIEMCAERAREEARDVLKNHVKPFDWVKERFWPNTSTIEEYDRLLHEVGDEEGLGSKRIAEIREELDRIAKEEGCE